MGGRCQLVVFVRTPQMGRVKTRLAAGVGAVQAWRIYRMLLQRTLSAVACDPRWETVLAVTPEPTPATLGAFEGLWAGSPPRPLRVIGQGRGDLGVRMQRVFEEAAPGPVLIIGSDCPGLHASHVARGFQALGRAPVVFGPATDGGYYLIGQRRSPKTLSLFANVRWSTVHALSDTLANLPAGVPYEELEPLSDLDESADLAALNRPGRRL